MDTTRKHALAAGLFYLATFVFSIPAVALYAGVLDDPDWVLGSGAAGGVQLGALIEILTALACVGTAVAVYPVIKRFGPARAMGFVASRTLEAAMIFTGVLAVMAIFTMRQHGGDPTALTTTADGLVAVKDWTFLVGPGLAPAVNALCFATVLHQSRLVPRWIPTIGLIGAPLLVISSITTLFGGWEQTSSTALLLALPIAAWALAVGIYMTVRGFRTQPAAGRGAAGAVSSSEPTALAGV
jgi:hypothetical protein